ncbi:MAG: hypothetical protein WD118_00400 [Phycisphaeraceae bacterium]
MAMSLTAIPIVAGTVLVGAGPRAGAGAPQDVARSDVLPVVLVADALSLLGDDTVTLIGWLDVALSSPRLEDGIQVRDLQIQGMRLRGASRLGIVTVTEAANDVSLGEVRSLQAGAAFPASASLDLFLEAALPATPFGALDLRNKEPLSVQATVSSWPPLSVTLSGDFDSEGACVPFIDSAAEPTIDPWFCVRQMTLAFAPQLPSYSVGRGGPSQLHTADVLALTPAQTASSAPQAPVVRIACARLGLTTDGCDDGADGDQDNLSALSYGDDLGDATGVPSVEFSVAPGAAGAGGSAVAVQANCPPGQPGASPEAESDVFRSTFNATNQLLLDGNGPVGACEHAFPLGLVEALGGRDNLDALTGDPSSVDRDGDGFPERPVYFALDAASPSLASLGFGPGDVLTSVGGAPAMRFASADQLGLEPGDAIDGLCLRESGDGTYGAADNVVFTLASGSPTLAAFGAAPGALLAPGRPSVVLHRSTALGLVAPDDVDALACPGALDSLQRTGDVDCSGATDGIDAMLVLQWHAGLLKQLPCALSGDVDESGVTDSRDAALVLQFEAGLVERLPV